MKLGQDALLWIAEMELRLSGVAGGDFSLMGVWDHTYKISAHGQNTTTHYVYLPYYAEFEYKPEITLGHQHGEVAWFYLSAIADDEKLNSYMHTYVI